MAASAVSGAAPGAQRRGPVNAYGCAVSGGEGRCRPLEVSAARFFPRVRSRQKGVSVRSRLRRVWVLPVAAVLALGGALAVAAQASAEPIGSSASPVVNYVSSLCLGISGGDDDAPAVQYTCNGHPDQQWYEGAAYPSDPQFYQIVNADGECLGVAGGNTAPLARVVGWSCQGPSALNQYWVVVEGPTYVGACTTTATFTLTNAETGYDVGVVGNSLTVGAPLVMYPDQQECNNQQWLLDPSNFPYG